MKWQVVIGLEIHAQLSTKSKIFSGASTTYGAKANVQACAVDLGMPGVLPVLNEQAIFMAIKFGHAIEASILERSVFARKNYFYPDLPKGYQISQYELPIVSSGHVDILLEEGLKKRINITRAHLEEDAGKSVHEAWDELTGIDLNRAGTPLLEIVSEPEISNAREAVAYMKKIHSILCYLDICDGNMQEGSFRCDANVSVKLKEQQELGTRTELKNINSFRFVEKAINHEVQRQIVLLEDGDKVLQETRLYDPVKDETRPMRSKEEAHDYRYFPDPDLLPVIVEKQLIEKIRLSLPELPEARKSRFISSYGLNINDATLLTSQKELADYFENCVKNSKYEAKIIANWVNGELAAALNRDNIKISESPISSEMLIGLIKRVTDNSISGNAAKQVFQAMWNGEGDADSIIKTKGLKQLTDINFVISLVDEIITENQDQLKQYQNSTTDKQKKLISYFVGKAMKKSKGKVNPQQVKKLFKEKLEIHKV